MRPGGLRNQEDVYNALIRIEQRQVIEIALLARVLQRQEVVLMDLDQLETHVTSIEGAADSAVALISALAAEIRANATDPAKLSALADRLDAKTQSLGAAIAANPA
jgi:hypothetical protein